MGVLNYSVSSASLFLFFVFATIPSPLFAQIFKELSHHHHHHRHRGGVHVALPESDVELLEFPLNLEYLEAEFFLWGALGHGLDVVAPNLTEGGPSPVGARKAALDPLILDVVTQFAYQEVGHIRLISSVLSYYSFFCVENDSEIALIYVLLHKNYAAFIS